MKRSMLEDTIPSVMLYRNNHSTANAAIRAFYLGKTCRLLGFSYGVEGHILKLHSEGSMIDIRELSAFSNVQQVILYWEPRNVNFIHRRLDKFVLIPIQEPERQRNE